MHLFGGLFQAWLREDSVDPVSPVLFWARVVAWGLLAVSLVWAILLWRFW